MKRTDDDKIIVTLSNDAPTTGPVLAALVALMNAMSDTLGRPVHLGQTWDGMVLWVSLTEEEKAERAAAKAETEAANEKWREQQKARQHEKDAAAAAALGVDYDAYVAAKGATV